MNNKIFIDSSIFIENFKGNSTAKEILEVAIDICINSIVFSEVIFKLLALKSGKSPLTLRSQKSVSPLIKELKDYSNLLLLFNVLGETKDILRISLNYMHRYNLLTNDALILSTCKYYNIPKLVSFDRDFEEVAKNEDIQLIKSAKDFEL
ncbi:MAG: PIN domain-containing protein [Aquificae bacterium]|nr:PIN domain-containing protein [Aquificota bacterium]